MTPRLGPTEDNPTGRLRNAPVIDRLMFRTAVNENGCWDWLGSTNPKGYGHIRRDLNGPVYAVHRVAYEALVGPIPEGLEIDHTCGNRRCVNPAHLEAVTHLENVNRGRKNQNHGKTHCHNGHEFTPDNTYTHKGKRSCRECGRLTMQRYRESRAA